MTRVGKLVADGTSVVLVEQNIPAALSVASRVYMLRSGRIILDGPATTLAAKGPLQLTPGPDVVGCATDGLSADQGTVPEPSDRLRRTAAWRA